MSRAGRVERGVWLAVVAMGASLLGSCALLGGAGVGGGTTAGGKLSGSCTGDFGASAAAQKLEIFLTATAEFTSAAAGLETSLVEACVDMGRELGVSDEAMAAKEGVPRVRAACAPVRAALEAELSDLKASARLDVAVQAEPPRCEVSVDAYANCVAECQVDVDPGKLDVRCEGGELRGQCEAECTGRCAVEVQGECGGRCEGSCSGSCSGTCNGTCDGTCSAVGADGACAGRCDGTCSGRCSASCEGSCEGRCVAKAEGRCDGECRGGCSVEFEKPYCTGEVRAPSASAECNAGCEAHFDASIDCEPGKLSVDVTGAIDSNIPEKAARVRAALEGGLARIIAARAQLERLAVSGKAMVGAAGQLPKAVKALGIGAAACVTQAAAILPRAVASVSISIEVSASISASAGASAG